MGVALPKLECLCADAGLAAEMPDATDHAYAESELGPTGFCDCGHLEECHNLDPGAST